MTYHQNVKVRTSTVEHTVQTENHGTFAVSLELSRNQDRFEVTALHVIATEQHRPVTAVAVRNLGLADLIRESRSACADADPATNKWEITVRQYGTDGEYLGFGPDSTRDLDEDDLKVVASLYDDAYQRGEPVQRFIAESLGVAISTAARRISLARKSGFISPDINRSRISNNTRKKVEKQ